MTRRTLPVQPQEGILPLFQLRVIDKVGNVALAAIYFTVRPRQFITRQVVVEVFFIEPHHVEFSSVVFAVAFGAVFTSGLPGSVVARLPIDEALYFFVAIQAFIIWRFSLPAYGIAYNWLSLPGWHARWSAARGTAGHAVPEGIKCS